MLERKSESVVMDRKLPVDKGPQTTRSGGSKREWWPDVPSHCAGATSHQPPVISSGRLLLVACLSFVFFVVAIVTMHLIIAHPKPAYDSAVEPAASYKLRWVWAICPEARFVVKKCVAAALVL